MGSNKIMITQSYTLVSRTKVNRTNQNLPISMSDRIQKNENPTICILHSTLRDATTTYMGRWVAGQFSFDSTGTSANHFGQTNGVNTWIAEIGDVGVGINEIENDLDFSVFPNPVNGSQLNIFSKNSNSISNLILTDILGKTIFASQNLESKEIITINLPQGLSGVYFLTIQSKTNQYETYKVIINN